MTVDQAFEFFESTADARGLARLADQELPKGVSRKVEFCRDDAGLRLVWSEQFESLSLGITHGPQNGAPVGWFDLYRAASVSGQLKPDQVDFDFEEAVDHGLSLLTPNFKPAP